MVLFGCTSRGRISRDEFHREGVNAMSGIGLGKPFTEENVAQVAAAVGTLNLDSHTVGVG